MISENYTIKSNRPWLEIPVRVKSVFFAAVDFLGFGFGATVSSSSDNKPANGSSSSNSKNTPLALDPVKWNLVYCTITNETKMASCYSIVINMYMYVWDIVTFFFNRKECFSTLLDLVILPNNYSLFHIMAHNSEVRWWKRWHSGESTHLPPMWPRFGSQILCHMWVEFVDSPICSERFFSAYSSFPLSSKTNIDLICANCWFQFTVSLISVLSSSRRLVTQIKFLPFICFNI